jgi:transcription elongation factor Elf1
MTFAVIEHPFTCPYCWESITMLLDLTVADQNYVEDCEVCCNPINLRFRTEQGEIAVFDAQQLS